MNRRLWEIVEELSEEEYRTSGYLGERLGISEKTVRTRINELNEEISGHGAQAVSRPRYGYCLEMCAEHGANLTGASPVTGIYRQV